VLVVVVVAPRMLMLDVAVAVHHDSLIPASNDAVAVPSPKAELI
jgi:hypothetical protein